MCTDNARAMVWLIIMVDFRLQKLYGLIHHEFLASQHMCSSLNTVLETVINVVNSVVTRFFKNILCYYFIVILDGYRKKRTRTS